MFPRLKKIEVKRPEKFGGDVKYDSFERLEKDYFRKNLQPADAKTAVAESLTVMLEPVRKHLEKKGLEYKEAY